MVEDMKGVNVLLRFLFQHFLKKKKRGKRKMLSAVRIVKGCAVTLEGVLVPEQLSLLGVKNVK